MTTSQSRFVQLLLAAAFFSGLAACGRKESKEGSSSVAAVVGSEAISVNQINQVLSRSKLAGTSPQAEQAMRHEMLEKLIDQQLAVNEATKKELHRLPQVMSEIKAARNDILAQAYRQQIASAQPKPSTDDVKKYYAEHPQLFSDRRIFNVQEIVVPAASGTADQIRSHASTGKSIEEVASWLNGKGIKFEGGSATRAAEQIPLELLTKIHGLKDGQSVVIESPQAITLLRLASSQRAPIAEAAALPRIEEFLTNQRAADAVAANIKRLRTHTHISYAGDFSKPEGLAVAEKTKNQTRADGLSKLK